MITDFRFGMGDGVKDQVTGFSGHVLGRSQWITGCNQYLVVPKLGKDGKYPNGQWFDENRLAPFGKNVTLDSHSKVPAQARPTGGLAESYPSKRG